VLNSNHVACLRATFRSVDESLAHAVALLDSSRDGSPFSELAHDATPVQRKVVMDYVSRIRAEMRSFLESNGAPLSEPMRSSVWAARTAILMAVVAVEELGPKYMRGYGEVLPEDSKALTAAVAQITDLLDRILAYLSHGPGRDLQARLKRITAVTDEIALLRKLERVITEYGLVEYRGTLEMLLDRIEARTCEIAVFGRVSSGKSSLLNYLLNTDVLPVGVTPVTGVPINIVYATRSRATISFAESQPIEAPPEQLVEYASEQRNPGNHKHVTRIVVGLPADRLRQGITIVDTPGVGSLASSGAAESMAYLPRCDLGIVLVDAGSTLVPDDVALVELLLQAGATVQVLLSKSDLLNDLERTRAMDYAKAQLRDQLCMDVPVYAISVRGEAAALCHHWSEAVLAASLAQHNRLAEESLRRKVATLRDSVETTLRDRRRGQSPVMDIAAWQISNRRLTEATMLVDATLAEFRSAMKSPGSLTELVFKDVVDSLSTSDVPVVADGTLAEHISNVLSVYSSDMATDRVAVLRHVQSELTQALRSVSEAMQNEFKPDAQVAIVGMPALSVARERLKVALKPTWRRILGRRAIAQNFRKQLDSTVRGEVLEVLDRYGKALDGWCQNLLQKMRCEFVAKADFYRASAARPRTAFTESVEMRDDLDELTEAHSHRCTSNGL
jgi:GTP-binding protein EngB required for normal cell division